jgi:hypothetical protein|tara:strand:- start:798 stop:938 length:141 start_codon:yes stop_codon:yes gene_type:complete
MGKVKNHYHYEIMLKQHEEINQQQYQEEQSTIKSDKNDKDHDDNQQ